MDERKLNRKLRKCLAQAEKYDSNLEVSDIPTRHLFVGNSSVLCGVSLENLERIFHEYDSSCICTVFPNQRPYSFVSFDLAESAEFAYKALHGKVSPLLGKNALPFYIAYLKKCKFS